MEWIRIGDKVKGKYCIDYYRDIFKEYNGIVVSDFNDGSYVVLIDDKEVLIETYYDDTILLA